MAHLLRIQPRTIAFPASLGFSSETKLRLINITRRNIAYKITSPERSIYSAHPQAGIILPVKETDVILTQHIDEVLSQKYDGPHRFVLHVIDLRFIPGGKSHGSFHGYSTVEDLLNAVPQESVTVMEIPINGMFGDWDASCEANMYTIGSEFPPPVFSSDKTVNMTDSPLSIISWDQADPKYSPKLPEIHLNPVKKQEKQPPKNRPVGRASGAGSIPSPTTPSRQRKAENLVQQSAIANFRQPKKSVKAATEEDATRTSTLQKTVPSDTANATFVRDLGSCLKVPSNITLSITPNKQAQAILQLRNVSEIRFAYKLFSNNHKRYGANPYMGILKPHSDVMISVTQTASRRLPHDLNNCQDYFLIRVADIEQLSRDGIITLNDTSNAGIDVEKVFSSKAMASKHVKSATVRIRMRKAYG